MEDFLDEKQVAIPLPEFNSRIVLSMYVQLIRAREEWRSYNERGADYNTYKIISSMESLFLYTGAMMKRSDEELYKKFKAFINKPDMNKSFEIIEDFGVFLDDKNITKMDLRTARSKRGVEVANKHKGY